MMKDGKEESVRTLRREVLPKNDVAFITKRRQLITNGK